MKKNFLFFICLLALNTLFLACESDDNTPKVGVCLKDATHEWPTALKKYAEKNLNKYGLTYALTQSAGTAQGTDILDVLSKGPEVMIIMPDGEQATEAVSEVISQGIPVIFAEAAIGDDYTALVKIDNKDIGRSAGEFFNKQQNISKIALFSVSKDPESSEGRIAGIKEVLREDLKNNTVIKDLTVYTAAAGKTAMQEILKDMTDVDAIYAQDDEIATGVLQALDAVSSEQIKAVVGCGGSYAFYTKIENSININLATTLYSPAAFMEKSVEIANSVLKGSLPTEKVINLESALIDKENVADYKKDAPY